MTPDELVALGLYDPDAPGADERLELLQLSLDHGATLAEIREAIAENRLHAVAALRVVEGGTERLTVDEVAARAGMSVDEVRRLWRSLGFVDPEPGAQPFTERDVELFRAAWERVIARYTALRTAFFWNQVEQPLQVVFSRVEAPWSVEDWRSLADRERRARFDQLLHQDRRKGLALDTPPLLRFTLIRAGEQAYRFMTDAFGSPLHEAPDAPEQALGQVERAISATLEHHAHLRLMPAAARTG